MRFHHRVRGSRHRLGNWGESDRTEAVKKPGTRQALRGNIRPRVEYEAPRPPRIGVGHAFLACCLRGTMFALTACRVTAGTHCPSFPVAAKSAATGSQVSSFWIGVPTSHSSDDSNQLPFLATILTFRRAIRVAVAATPARPTACWRSHGLHISSSPACKQLM
jgi:hypothetical protein